MYTYIVYKYINMRLINVYNMERENIPNRRMPLALFDLDLQMKKERLKNLQKANKTKTKFYARSEISQCTSDKKQQKFNEKMKYCENHKR